MLIAHFFELFNSNHLIHFYYTQVFCLGHNSDIVSPVLLAVIRILESVPESGAAKEIDAAFPWAGSRPDLNSHLTPLLAAAGIVSRSVSQSFEKVPRHARPVFDQYQL